MFFFFFLVHKGQLKRYLFLAVLRLVLTKVLKVFLVLFCSCFLVKSVGESLLQCRISGYYDVTDGNGKLNSIIL